jgi:hypothetical protein
MSIGITSDRLLNGLSRHGVIGSFCYDPAAGISANSPDDSPDLSERQLASLRRALEFDLGPDLAGIRVYIGAKGGGGSTNATRDHRFRFGELRFEQT